MNSGRIDGRAVPIHVPGWIPYPEMPPMKGWGIDLKPDRRTVAAMKRHYAALGSLAFSCLLVGACAVTYGNKAVSSATSYEGLKPGTATKADVYDALGQPSDVLVMEQGVLWTYRYRRAKNDLMGNIPLFGINLIAGGKNGDVYTLLVLFDRKGVLAGRTADRRKLYTSNLASLKRSVDGMLEDDLSSGRVAAEMKLIGKPFNKDAAKESHLLEASLD